MYNSIIEHLKFYNKLIEYAETYGKPYTISYLTNTYPYSQAVTIIQELYRINWGKNAGH
jgi:hypothetical protein